MLNPFEEEREALRNAIKEFTRLIAEARETLDNANKLIANVNEVVERVKGPSK